MAVTESSLELTQRAQADRTQSRVPRIRTGIVAIDAVAVLAGVVVASALQSPGPDGRWAIVAMFVAYGFWFARARLYQSRFITRRSDEVRRIVNAGVQTAASVALVDFTFGLATSRSWLALSTATTIVLLTVDREMLRRRFAARRSSGRLSRRVLLIGDNNESARFVELFREEPELGYSIVTTIDPLAATDPRELTTTVLAAARQNEAHGVIIATTAIDVQSSNRLTRDLVEAGIHVELSSTLTDISFDRLTVRPLGRFPVVYIEPRARHGWRAVAKRAFDLAIAGTASVILAPLFLVIALLVRLDSRGPVLFRQERVGKDGEPFEVLKFRTMVVNAEAMLETLATADEGAGPLFKMKSDPRVTRVGELLRKTSLDELPQLWNVVRGNMSLVGPRPEMPFIVAEYDEWQRRRLSVKPGITGLWQILGRKDLPMHQNLQYDFYYIRNRSLALDVSILLRTIGVVFSRRGAF